ncbi:MAG TPA: GldM family protein [Bacteroidia bacterium]|nr:GldM family protein [Bacteroidia bacterium]
MGKALLSIYETELNGVKKIVLNKPYSVITYPIIKFGGVASDSAMPAIMLAASGMYVHYNSLNTKIPVTGFKMEFYENGKFTLDSSLNNRLSKKMLAYVGKLKPGSMVYFTGIKYKNPKGVEEIAPIFRVFIIKQKNSTGFGM